MESLVGLEDLPGEVVLERCLGNYADHDGRFRHLPIGQLSLLRSDSVMQGEHPSVDLIRRPNGHKVCDFA